MNMLKTIGKKLYQGGSTIANFLNRNLKNIGHKLEPIVNSDIYKKIKLANQIIGEKFPNPFSPLIATTMDALEYLGQPSKIYGSDPNELQERVKLRLPEDKEFYKSLIKSESED